MKKHLTLLMLAALLMSACATDRISRRPVVTTTIAPLAFLIEQIAGDDYDIVVLTPDGSTKNVSFTLSDGRYILDCECRTLDPAVLFIG